MHNITAVILAGGKSTRMKQDKALVKINKKTLLQHQIELLKPIFSKILISANINYNYNYPIINDTHTNIGPIGGIYSILQKTSTSKAFIIAVDMPFITSKIINTLIDNSKNYDITTPIINGKLEPTCAIYTQNCISKIEQQITSKNYKLLDLIDKCNTNYIKFETDNLKHFKNLNTPNDL